MPDGQTYEDRDLLWAACNNCHELIEKQDWTTLVDRAARGALRWQREGAPSVADTPANRNSARIKIALTWIRLFGVRHIHIEKEKE